MTVYLVHTSKKPKQFKTLQAASAFAASYFAKTGVVVAITAKEV